VVYGVGHIALDVAGRDLDGWNLMHRWHLCGIQGSCRHF
jgi:hypothetical protein